MTSGLEDGLLEQGYDADERRGAGLGHDFVARRTGPECGGLQVPDDADAREGPAGEHEEAHVGAVEVGYLLHLDRDRVRVSVGPLERGGPIVSPQVAAERGVVTLADGVFGGGGSGF